MLRTVRLTLWFAVLASAGVPSEASTVNVSPTRVVLAAGTAGGSLSIRNDSPAAVRFQVRACRWSNVGTAELSLEPTDDLLFFPSLLMLQPGESRLIRVGARVAAGPRERTYRLLLKELDSLAEPASGSGVRMALEISVPVFVQPRDLKVAADVPPPEITGGTLVLRLTNTGPVHLTPQRVEVRGMDTSGRIVWTRSFKPWYLLAGESRRYSAAIDARDCQQTAQVATEVLFEELADRPLRPRGPVPAGACSGP
jgi:fimbrial chaperone protein